MFYKMKKDKTLILIFIISCILQEMYCCYNKGLLYPFSFLQGLNIDNNCGLPYLELCAICLPTIILVLLFSDTYKFYFEEYGCLLLIRNCNLQKRILKIYYKIICEILVYVFIEFIISLIFNYKYFYDNSKVIVMQLVIYVVNVFLLITLEVFLCSCAGQGVCQIFINIYVYLSLIVSFYMENKMIRIVYFPGIFVYAGKQNNIEGLCRHFLENLTMQTIFIGAIYGLTVFRCKRKDYLI